MKNVEEGKEKNTHSRRADTVHPVCFGGRLLGAGHALWKRNSKSEQSGAERLRNEGMFAIMGKTEVLKEKQI